MKDYIVRAIADNENIRVFCCVTTNLVERARNIHNTTPVATAALGRVLSACSMMGIMSKGEKDTITIQIKGSGPLGGILGISDSKANVRGYVHNPEVELPLKPNGKLDVSRAVGEGYLNIIKDLGLKDPYIGQVPLISGEIGEDLAYYFTKSEQINSVVGLGVLIERDYTVGIAGGFIIQAMPGISEESLSKLENCISGVESVTNLFKQYRSPEEVVKFILKGFEITFTDTIETKYECNCSKDRVERALISMGKKDLLDLIETQGQAELTCHFCDRVYNFEKEDLQALYEKSIK